MQMKIAAYEVRADERPYFEEFAAAQGCELVMTDANLTMDTLSMANGCDGVTTLGQSSLKGELLDRLHDIGIKAIATRTIGYNHIDLKRCDTLGIQVCNAAYAPNGVADYTIMLMLMCLRNYKQALFRLQVNDYSLSGLRGREMKDLTVGVVGTGRIGQTVLKNLSGFGCRLLCYDVYENETAKLYASYKTLDEILSQCDIISLHVPLLPSTKHLINKESIAKLKDGAVIINCARGELISLPDVIEGIESEKIGALGLDVVENEEGIYHLDRRSDIIQNKDMAYLRQFPNVIMTPHMAFYTDAATRSMVQCGVEGLLTLLSTGTCSTHIKLQK